MVERGYAVLEADPADGRRTMVVLTPGGEAYGRAVWAAQDALNDLVRRRVSARDLAIADSVLRAIFPGGERRRRIDRWMPAPKS
jgi:DNA-binding MarR family transcriptional regulator